MKTKKDWDKSGKNLQTFLQVGDLVDDEMVDYFIEVLPPACMSPQCLQIGEPFDYDEHGCLMFSTLICTAEGWQYAGEIVTPDGERCNYS